MIETVITEVFCRYKQFIFLISSNFWFARCKESLETDYNSSHNLLSAEVIKGKNK